MAISDVKLYCIGSLLGDDDGMVSHTTIFPIHGKITKIFYDDILVAANGSILVEVETAAGKTGSEIIWQVLNPSADILCYPRTTAVDTVNADPSGNPIWIEKEVNDKLVITGSSIGSPGSFGMTIYYK